METIQLPTEPEMLRAFETRDSSYDGVFFTAVKTTGIFCRPACPARKPKKDNIRFFATSRDALCAGFRPCKRCHPLEPAGKAPDWVSRVIDEVERDPGRRWKDADLRALSLEPERVRRWFKANHGMTFHQYQRARRLGLALGRIQVGEELTASAYEHGFESDSGFRDAFRRLFGTTPGRSRESGSVVVNRILTPLGPMLAGATTEGLCLLEFVDRRMLETQLRTLQRLVGTAFPGTNEHIEKTSFELAEYFAGRVKEFTVPVVAPGSEFQARVWAELRAIPYGETRSYEDIAKAIGRPGAQRAVGKANGDNRIAIVIPCHRVIRSDGTLSGYGGGVWRKKKLLELESNAD